MVDNESTTKVGEGKKDGIPEEESADLLSLESLDSIIATEDPEFAKSLDEIGPDVSISGEVDHDGAALEYTLKDEVKHWKNSQGWRKKAATVFPFLPGISYRVRVKRTQMRLSWLKWKEQALYRLKNAGPLLLAWFKNQSGKIKTGVGKNIQTFKAFGKLKKLAFVGLIFVTGAAAYILYRAATSTLLPHEEDLFVGSMAEWAQQKYQYSSEDQMESFFESTRTSQNILLMKKMTVNLRRSAASGPNPMGAFEFYVEGAASEVVVEIKDREPEMEDLFLRTIEDMTYDQIATAEGKQLLCDKLRKEVNKVLTKGYVRRVFIKTLIIKP